jgi:hypothetical protein
MEKTFEERFCSHYHLPPERYRSAMFRRCLYRRTLIVYPLFWLFRKGYFDADLQLISNVGLLRRREDLNAEIDAFRMHCDNMDFPRRVLRLRISTQRVRYVVKALIPAAWDE